MKSFKAGTQYGDWKGTAAADNQYKSIREWLNDKKLIEPGEFLIAVTLSIYEHYSSVNALVFQNGENFESVKRALEDIEGPIPVREIKVELTTEEFLGLFKYFSVVLTHRGLPLEGREYDVAEN